MSPGGVASDSSVTLTLADAQGMLDGVTLNLNAQVTRTKHQQPNNNDFQDQQTAHRAVQALCLCLTQDCLTVYYVLSSNLTL